MRRPVAVLALAYAAGIFIERYYPVSNQVLCGAGACFLSAAIVCIFMRRAAIGAGAIVLLTAVLGALAYAPFHALPPSVTQLEGWLHRPVVVEAEVRLVEPLASGALRLMLSYDSIETAEEQLVCSGLVQATLQKVSRNYHYGQRLRVSCRLRRPRNFNNPGGFDYERFLAHRNIYFTTFLNDDQGVIVLQENGGHPLRGALERYRSQLRSLICEHLEAPERDMVLALLLGEKQTLDPDIKDRFARLGVAHLLAISGLHIGIVATIAFALACFLLRLYPRLLLFVDLWKAAGLVSIVPAVLYCCVAGLQIPTLRSGIMIVTCIAALFINRRPDVLNALGLAAFIILIWMPASLFEISFQLSFIAVFSLILYAPYCQKLLAAAGPPDAQRIRAPVLWLYRFLGGLLAASIIASVATAPLTALYFQQLSLAGILSNCILIPAIGFGAVPCSLLAAILLPLSQTAAAWLFHAAALILHQSLVLIRYWSDWPLIFAQVPPPSTVALCACYALLLCLPPCIRTRRFVLPCLLCAAAVLLWFGHPANSVDGLLRITFLDVGQGDATIIQFPQGQVMLIDSGGLSSDRFDTGESIVAPALMALGIRRVNWLVISHPHHDHMAGMPYILEYFQPKELWVPRCEYPDPFFSGIVRSARRKGLTVRTPVRGTAPLSIDGVVVEFLSPDATQAETAQAYHDLNDSSLVMKIRYGSHAFLFSGDISARQEQVLLERDLDIRAQVLKVPHHGKRSSSSQAFLDAVNPERAIFSCRPYAGSDIPTDVLNRYRFSGVQELRTDRHGAIQITSNGTQLETYMFMPHREFRP